MEDRDLRGIVRALIEARIRETDITDGRRVQFGSIDHISDLEARISDLERWRDRQRRGSEARANYARLISQLKRELRSALRVNEPKSSPEDDMLDLNAAAESAPVAMPIQSAVAEADGPKGKKRRVKCKCGKVSYVSKSGTDSSEPYVCEKCDDKQIAKDNRRVNESAGSWIVFHQYDRNTIGFPTGRVEAEQNAMGRNRVARLGAWGKQNPGKEPPYIVVPADEVDSMMPTPEEREAEYWASLPPPKTRRKPTRESVDMEDPEYSSLEDFVQFLLDDERDTYTHEDLAALNFRTRMPINNIRKELEGYGFKLASRAPEKQVRGFTSNSHDRWHGKGSLPTHGGAGIDASTGRATVRGRTV